MASVWAYIGRFFRYFFGRLLIWAIAAALVILSFFVCMDYMNVNVLIRDGFYKRAATIMHINEDPSILIKVFTKSFIDKDTLLKSDIYDAYVIRGFNHKLDVDFKLIFPWDDTIQVDITERIPYIDGELPVSSEDTKDTGETIKPPEWQDGRYTLTLARDQDNWRITAMELIKKLPKEEPEEAVQTSPAASGTEAASASASASSASESPSGSN